MRDYYTERVCDVLHQCNRFGINAFNYYPSGRVRQDFERFRAERRPDASILSAAPFKAGQCRADQV